MWTTTTTRGNGGGGGKGAEKEKEEGHKDVRMNSSKLNAEEEASFE